MFHAVNNAKVYSRRQQEYLRLAAVVGCDALGAFLSRLKDDEFRRRLDELHARQKDDEYREILDDLDRLEDLLVEDQRLLVAAGMDWTVADELFRRARLLAADMRKRKYVPIWPFEITVRELRESTCDLASHLRKEEQQQAEEQQQQDEARELQQTKQEERQKRRRFLGKVAFAVGGTAVIGVNLAADTGSLAFGVPPWATTFSTNVGQTLMGGALPTG